MYIYIYLSPVMYIYLRKDRQLILSLSDTGTWQRAINQIRYRHMAASYKPDTVLAQQRARNQIRYRHMATSYKPDTVLALQRAINQIRYWHCNEL